jgi:hypothetical protein
VQRPSSKAVLKPCWYTLHKNAHKHRDFYNNTAYWSKDPERESIWQSIPTSNAHTMHLINAFEKCWFGMVWKCLKVGHPRQVAQHTESGENNGALFVWHAWISCLATSWCFWHLSRSFIETLRTSKTDVWWRMSRPTGVWFSGDGTLALLPQNLPSALAGALSMCATCLTILLWLREEGRNEFGGFFRVSGFHSWCWREPMMNC